MKAENAIEVRNVTKKFRVYSDKGHTLKEKTLFRKRRAFEERNVLNGISFDVKKGEAVGLIGHNGCGKSTTLKLLTKIMYPDSGTIEMRGRVSSLLELGAGFHPDMSGRENIYVNAAIFGLTKREIDGRIADIISFSELEEFIDNPVRTYSSGMYMRLAFSVAINVEADILLIDEILAVGDAGFQAKCFNRLKEIKAGGTTIVIVSHSMGQIEQICDRSVWLHGGEIKAEGKPRDVDPQYLDHMEQQRQAAAEMEGRRREEKQKRSGEKETGRWEKNSGRGDKKEAERWEEKNERGGEKKNGKESLAKGKKEEQRDSQAHKKLRWGNGKVRIEAVHLLNADGKETAGLKTDDPAVIKIDYKVNEPVEDAVFGIGIFRVDGVQCYGTNTRIDRLEKFDIKKDGTACFVMDSMTLLPGSYLLDVAVECGMGIPVDYYKEAYRFKVFSQMDDVGIVRLKHQWDI